MKKYRNNNTNTIGYFNLLRGYGMFFVLFFHTRILYFVRSLIASPLMEIFPIRTSCSVLYGKIIVRVSSF